jgi:REP element-mobilizing transposase RayT
MNQPGRKQLPHGGPPWPCDLTGETYFITICAVERINQPLLQNDIAKQLLEAIKYYNEKQRWWVPLALVMPDHLHFLATFPEEIAPVIRAWKHWSGRQLNVKWQRDFFDHRLRRDEKFNETAEYILHNPVRAGLVDDWQKWPHVLITNN